MIILASTLVALSVFDLFPTAVVPSTLPTSSFRQTGAGELTVSLLSAEGVGSVARGASRIPLGIIDFSADCTADITLESVDLRHTGLGSVSDIRAVYMTDGLRRVTRAQRFDPSRSVLTLRFSSPITVKRCDVQRFTIMVDLSQTAEVASEHALALMAGTVQSSAKTVTIDERKDTSTLIATPYQQGMITVRFLDVQGPLRYGRREIVARLQITADAKHSHLLKKITLTNVGSARDLNLVNFTLQRGDGLNLISPAMRMHGRSVVLEFSPSFPLPRGQTVMLKLSADIRGSHSDTVQLVLEEPSDLVSIPSNIR